MKKSLLALAVFSAFAGAATAQNNTNVTIYGVVDAGITYDRDSDADNRRWGLDSGNQSGSRIGFRGTEDLGGGLSAIFTLENGFAVDTGGITSGTGLFTRQAWVGLSGNTWGAVKLGRQYSPLHLAVDSLDPFGTNLAGDMSSMFGSLGGGSAYGTSYAARTDNTISYSTPSNLAGFSGAIHYGFGEAAGNNSNFRTWGLGLGYANGPINVQFAWQHLNEGVIPATATAPARTLGDYRSYVLGGTYNFNVVKAHAAYGYTRLDGVGAGAGDARARHFLLGATVPFGPHTFMASWIHNNRRDVDDGRANLFAIGYSYKLSNRTNFYSSFGHTNNDDNVDFRTGRFNNTPVADENNTRFNVGIRHTF